MQKTPNGYTLVEIMVVMGVFVVLLGLISVNFIRPQQVANVESVTLGLFADLRTQQNRAMVGDATNTSSSQSYGIRIDGSTYTLFQGSTYNSTAASNVVIKLTPVTASNTLPNNQIIFSRVSGEVASFMNGQNTITLNSNGEQKVLTINRYGVVSIQ